MIFFPHGGVSLSKCLISEKEPAVISVVAISLDEEATTALMSLLYEGDVMSN